jgi:glutamate-1-semialdehyde 2,1-aminomutase
MDFSQSKRMGERLRHLVPGGSHTYAKAADQFPELAPAVLARGSGCHVWDPDGNEFVEYGMGLRAVTLGHAFPPVVEAVRESLALGTNFTRPAVIELACAEAFLATITGADMVKFTKDGSTATSAAVKLARAFTGRELVGICAEQPFFSYDDWFICTTTSDAGIPDVVRSQVAAFRYDDLDSVGALFDANPGRVAAIMLEAARLEDPRPGYLEGIRELCTKNGAVLILDEMITGFRWHRGGAQKLYGVTPDLSTFGKALANGFALAALCGRRDIMELGARDREDQQVFLLSTTHGAETPALAAAICTMEIYRTEPVIEHLHRQGERLAKGITQVAKARGVEAHVKVMGRPCNLVYGTTGPDGKPSQEFRTLFLQETIRRGILAPSLVVSYSHTDEDIDRTVAAVDGALEVYARAIQDGVDRYLVGPPSRLVYGRRW